MRCGGLPPSPGRITLFGRYTLHPGKLDPPPARRRPTPITGSFEPGFCTRPRTRAQERLLMRLPTALAVLLGLLVPVSAWAEPATKAPAEPAEVSEIKPAEARADDDKAPPARTPEEKPLDKKAP